jgi:SAM-dependent methyltransferase
MWPGADKRDPPISSTSWAVRAPLARWIEREAQAAGRRNGRVRVLDVGCGGKPYYPFFAPFDVEYVGVDVAPNAGADLIGTVENLPVDDGSFDVVLCTQVLEHCDDPTRAVGELRRVLAPGGRALASTHGVQIYHPAPHDLWRWTHEGLDRLFRESAAWSSVRVEPGAGTAATLAMLLGFYLELGSRRPRLSSAARVAVSGLNRGARALDRRSSRLRTPGPGTLFANFHVSADA